MRAIKRHVLSVPAAAGLFLVPFAHADDSTYFARGGDANKALQTVSSNGVSTRLSEIHWTSRIGTGRAEAVVARAEAVRYPETHWTARIGTGTATGL